MTAPRVLNVNDNVASRYLVTKILRNVGIEVLEAASGTEALALAAREPRPDLLVLDVRLPDIDGIEVCRRLKADPATRDIKVLHTSATATGSANKLAGSTPAPMAT